MRRKFHMPHANTKFRVSVAVSNPAIISRSVTSNPSPTETPADKCSPTKTYPIFSSSAYTCRFLSSHAGCVVPHATSTYKIGLNRAIVSIAPVSTEASWPSTSILITSTRPPCHTLSSVASHTSSSCHHFPTLTGVNGSCSSANPFHPGLSSLFLVNHAVLFRSERPKL